MKFSSKFSLFSSLSFFLHFPAYWCDCWISFFFVLRSFLIWNYALACMIVCHKNIFVCICFCAPYHTNISQGVIIFWNCCYLIRTDNHSWLWLRIVVGRDRKWSGFVTIHGKGWMDLEWRITATVLSLGDFSSVGQQVHCWV